MRGVHRLYANGRMQIFCLMILFMALESLAVINLTRGGNELDSILGLNPLPDSVFIFPDTDNQLTFELSNHYTCTATVTLTFTHIGNNPDKYPILRHTGQDNYDFLNLKIFLLPISFLKVIPALILRNIVRM